MTDIRVQTVNKAQSAEVEIESDTKAADIIDTAIDNWELPKDTAYKLTNKSTGITLNNSQTLQAQGVTAGDILEIQPNIKAGGNGT
jgi:uncharacterized ubiquitin-like protein YukD